MVPSIVRASTLVCTLACALACAKVNRGTAVPIADGGAATTDGRPPVVDANHDFGQGIKIDAPDATPMVGDPTTCEQAATFRTYVGCDYWPTVVANSVWSIFDFAVVVANGQTAPADVTVTGPNGVRQSTSVPPGSLGKIYLPWVADLKGPVEPDSCGTAIPLKASVVSPKGAYHLVSSLPVTVYQFNALEYKDQGGPPGKSWTSCPGLQFCEASSSASGCFSFSNDASLLLPSTAMTGNYRITGIHGWSETDIISGPYDVMGAYFAVTATQDGTTVKVALSAQSQTLAGGGIAATGPGRVLTLTLGQGDVAEVVSPIGNRYDFSGSLVSADKPVQVLTGIPCINLPQGNNSCDHVEESVLPAETLGKHYFVAAPTGPNGVAVGQILRLYGNVDGTTLTYAPAKPPGCPATLNAGAVADCGIVTDNLEIQGDHEIGVSTFLLGAQLIDPQSDVTKSRGDPSQTVAVAVEQYRTKYVFLAPDDYAVSFADVVGPTGARLVLDGAPVATPFTAIAGTGYGVARVKLGPGAGGAHVLTASMPVGLQVLGYGFATSYEYPGGLNLDLIAPPPIVP